MIQTNYYNQVDNDTYRNLGKPQTGLFYSRSSVKRKFKMQFTMRKNIVDGNKQRIVDGRQF